jgi:hypothetical protein
MLLCKYGHCDWWNTNALVVFIVYGKDDQTESLTDQILLYVATRCLRSKNSFPNAWIQIFTHKQQMLIQFP